MRRRCCASWRSTCDCPDTFIPSNQPSASSCRSFGKLGGVSPCSSFAAVARNGGKRMCHISFSYYFTGPLFNYLLPLPLVLYTSFALGVRITTVWCLAYLVLYIAGAFSLKPSAFIFSFSPAHCASNSSFTQSGSTSPCLRKVCPSPRQRLRGQRPRRKGSCSRRV